MPGIASRAIDADTLIESHRRQGALLPVAQQGLGWYHSCTFPDVRFLSIQGDGVVEVECV